MKNLLATGMLLTALFWAGCTTLPSAEPAETTADKKTVVIASFYPLAHFAEQVLGESVESITPVGVEPHDFEPSARQIVSIHEADLFLYNGGGLDPWAEALHEELLTKEITVIAIEEHIQFHEAEDDHDHGSLDPHVWLDPLWAIEEVRLIQNALSTIDPDNADQYALNATNYIEQLAALHHSFETTLSRCEKNTIIVAHDAFSYLSERYGFEQHAISGLSPDAEPSAKEIADLVDLARTLNIEYILFEELASPKLAETLANEIGATTLVLNPLEGLTQEEITNGESYLSIMEKNLESLALALECQ